MAALTAARSTKRKISSESPMLSGLSIPVKAATKCIQGGIAVLDAGLAAPGRTATGLIAIGRFEETADNSAGAGSAINARVRRGTFRFGNSAAADAIAQANVGQPCFIVDDQTVALTDGNGTRSYAGVIIDIDSAGVWVEVGGVVIAAPAMPLGTITIPLDLASLANGQHYAVTPGFAGRIKSVAVVVSKPATTAAKLATVTAEVASTVVTGGVVAITSANMTPAANSVPGTAITALNTFTAAQAIGVGISAVTAFVEGTAFAVLALG
jgi:hypothetical protein